MGKSYSLFNKYFHQRTFNWNSGIPAVVSTSRRGQTPIPNSVAMEHRDAVNNDNNINNMEVHNI